MINVINDMSELKVLKVMVNTLNYNFLVDYCINVVIKKCKC